MLWPSRAIIIIETQRLHEWFLADLKNREQKGRTSKVGSLNGNAVEPEDEAAVEAEASEEQSRRGVMRHGGIGHGEAGGAREGGVMRGMVRQGRSGVVWWVMAGLGTVWPAGCGTRYGLVR